MSNASSAMILAPRYMPNSHMASATRPASAIRASMCCPSRSMLSTAPLHHAGALAKLDHFVWDTIRTAASKASDG